MSFSKISAVCLQFKKSTCVSCTWATKQAAYPPNHYIRRVPEFKIHIFTGCQIVQLAILCAFGFNPWPYAKMIFPVVILAFLPIRQKFIPRIVEKKFLNVLDGHEN